MENTGELATAYQREYDSLEDLLRASSKQDSVIEEFNKKYKTLQFEIYNTINIGDRNLLYVEIWKKKS